MINDSLYFVQSFLSLRFCASLLPFFFLQLILIIFDFKLVDLNGKTESENKKKKKLVHRTSMAPSAKWNGGVILTLVSHMIWLQPLISICPSGDVPKRTAADLMDTLPWAPVHPFHPWMPLSPQSRIMSLSEIRLSQGWARRPRFLASPPFAKAFASPAAFRPLKKITALSAKCGRCFSRISWPGEYCLSPPECKRSTLCCHPGCLACLLSWMAG